MNLETNVENYDTSILHSVHCLSHLEVKRCGGEEDTTTCGGGGGGAAVRGGAATSQQLASLRKNVFTVELVRT